MKCTRCGRRLTDGASLARGFGEICGLALGLIAPLVKRTRRVNGSGQLGWFGTEGQAMRRTKVKGASMAEQDARRRLLGVLRWREVHS